MVVIFDVVGTLFSLDAVKRRFSEERLRPDLADFWFSKLLQSAMASTLASRYVPFRVVAESTLAQLLALEGIRGIPLEKLMAGLEEIEPRPDARGCIDALRKEGHRMVALSNSGYDETKRLLTMHGLHMWFERIYSADDVRACKPHPAPYELVLRTMLVGAYDCCMVAAHGWDILGAQSLGMKTVYVSRLERQWPFPGSPAGYVVTNLGDVPLALLDNYGGEGREAA